MLIRKEQEAIKLLIHDRNHGKENGELLLSLAQAVSNGENTEALVIKFYCKVHGLSAGDFAEHHNHPENSHVARVEKLLAAVVEVATQSPEQRNFAIAFDAIYNQADTKAVLDLVQTEIKKRDSSSDRRRNGLDQDQLNAVADFLARTGRDGGRH